MRETLFPELFKDSPIIEPPDFIASFTLPPPRSLPEPRPSILLQELDSFQGVPFPDFPGKVDSFQGVVSSCKEAPMALKESFTSLMVDPFKV